jgi:N-acetylmuramoyl-L-alanine amidase
MIIELPSPNQDERPCPVDMLILHYTGMQSAQAAIDRLRDSVAKVSSHYVVDEDGTVYCLVAEEKRAYHAGISFWRGRRALNDCSIGIEIVNPGHEWGYRAFPAMQIDAVKQLCASILSRHAIPARNVVGHSDVAPNRKQDPGELFPWQELAACGIGVWADTDGSATAPCDGDQTIKAAADLQHLGYDASQFDDPAALADAVRAFQRHWRPESVTGTVDVGTAARLTGLACLL